jgi:predicted lipoprotein with Yx(FWY)xxD motif
MHQFRRFIVAAAIPLAAVVGIALSSCAATGSSGAGVANSEAPATDNKADSNKPRLPSAMPPLSAQPPGQSLTFTKPPFTVFPSTHATKLTPTKSSAKPTPSRTRPSRTTPTRSPSPSKTVPTPSVGVVPAPGGVGCGHTATHPVTVKVGTAEGKRALVDGNGCALYLSTLDTPQASGCTGTCAQQWPPLIGPSQAGQGVRQANLGTFTRPDNSQQVTYFGHQLYYFSGDTQPGQANGEAVDQAFFLVNSQGTLIRQ